MHVNKPGSQSSAPQADRSEEITSGNHNFAGMDPYAVASLETPRPHPSSTPPASPEIQNLPSRVTVPGPSIQQSAGKGSAHFAQAASSGAPSTATEAFSPLRTPEKLNKARDALSADSPAFVTLVDNARTREALSGDTAVSFFLAMEHKGHPPPKA
jgi:hypothetical protein